MTGKFSLAAKLLGRALALAAVFQLAPAWADDSNESRPLRRWFANRQQNSAKEADQKASADASSKRANPSWRQDPRYQARGVFENWNVLPNDIYGRTNVYRVPPAEGFQKMYGPPANYPQTGSRGLTALFASKNNKNNSSAEGSNTPDASRWTPPPQRNEPRASIPSLPTPPMPAPLPAQPNAQLLPGGSMPTPSTPEPPRPRTPKVEPLPGVSISPLAIPEPPAPKIPRALSQPASASPAVATPLETAPVPKPKVQAEPKPLAQPAATQTQPAAAKTQPAATKSAPPNLSTLPEFDFPDPPVSSKR